MKYTTAEILCVGTEILIGDIVNTNAAFISRELASLGINQYYQSVVGDNPERLAASLSLSLERCDLVIMTGGLGPTYDDLTKETAAAAMGRKIIPNEREIEILKAKFASRGAHMAESNLKQAYMPEGAVVFANSRGTAPGCMIEDEARGKAVIMLPGPPREMTAMWREQVRPYLEAYCDRMLVSHNINLVGIGESALEEMLSELMQSSENPTIAPYCAEGEVRLRVTASAPSVPEADRLCEGMIETIRKTEAGRFIYGIDTTLPEAAVSLLRRRGRTLALAESCTGGLISKLVTDVAGASEVFLGGAVTYANSAKEAVLGVSHETLVAHGAVSAETALEMATGARTLLGADIAISVTGIAGPGGGSDEKPVGLVYMGIATEAGARALKFNFIGDRTHIRTLTANNAMAELIREMKG